MGIHGEYQWRRVDYIKNWQQSLLRVGVNYQYNPNILFRLGYGWIETFPYGEIPIQSMGKDFTEHRIFQMMQLQQTEGNIQFSHRFMLEQRFIGVYNNETSESEDSFSFLNRIRYMFRLQVPVSLKNKEKSKPYFACYDELFIGFGKNVNANIFDQNRIGIVFGYKFNDRFRFEAGYLNQTLQYGRLIDNQFVFQNNNGLICNAHFQLAIKNGNKTKVSSI